MQRLAPDVMLEHCERFQEGLEDVAKAALHQDIVKDRIAEYNQGIKVKYELGLWREHSYAQTCIYLADYTAI
eukprot:gene22279-28043_t